MTSHEYDYRGRSFTITIVAAPAGCQALVGEQSRGGWEWASADHADTFSALLEATQAIRELVDDEEGIPW